MDNDLSPKLVVVRHGEAEHNVESTFNSNPSHPNYKPVNLTPLGREQALIRANELIKLGYTTSTTAKLYVSPLPRAQQTAFILAEMNVVSPDRIVVDERLIESQMGDMEGKPLENFVVEDYWDLSHAATYGGETGQQVQDRMVDLYAEITREPTDGHIIWVTHGSPALEIIRYLTGSPMKLETAGSIEFPLLKGASNGVH